MSSYDRRTVLKAGALAIGGLAVLAGCGFTPAYGPSGGAGALRNSVQVAEPDTSAQFALVTRLEQRLGQPEAVAYTLDFSLNVDSDGVGITSTQTTSRFNLIGTAQYALTDATSGASVDTGVVRGVVGYSNTGTTIATDAARDDAYERLMVILADQIVARLIAATP
ncbi:MAG: LPS assembly lipoprotein LptE [Pseudomonadota bacterium]